MQLTEVAPTEKRLSGGVSSQPVVLRKGLDLQIRPVNSWSNRYSYGDRIHRYGRSRHFTGRLFEVWLSQPT
jgi:hypothetical protein